MDGGVPVVLNAREHEKLPLCRAVIWALCDCALDDIERLVWDGEVEVGGFTVPHDEVVDQAR